MTDGRRWLALDADLFGKRFTDDLYRQFGWAGVVTWLAFLCACKRSRHPGRISALNETEAAHILGIADWDLADNDGKPWTLEEFWAFTGRKKQTRRTRHGRRFDVSSTHWERWQDAAGRARGAEQKRTSRAQKRRDAFGHDPDMRRTNVRLDLDLDSDISQTHPGVQPPDPENTHRKSNGTTPRERGTNPRAKGTNPRSVAAETRREVIPEWQPEPEPDNVIDPAAVANLRANPSGKS